MEPTTDDDGQDIRADVSCPACGRNEVVPATIEGKAALACNLCGATSLDPDSGFKKPKPARPAHKPAPKRKPAAKSKPAAKRKPAAKATTKKGG